MSSLLGGPVLSRTGPTTPLTSSFFRPFRLRLPSPVAGQPQPPQQQQLQQPSSFTPNTLLGSANTATKLANLFNSDPNNIAGTAANGLGALGSVAGLVGNMTRNPTLAKAGSAAGVAGQGIRFAMNPSIAGGAGLLGSGLGLVGGLTGNRDLSLAGNLIGTGTSLYGLGTGLSALLAPGAAAALPTLGGAAAAGAAGAGAGAAAGAGAGAGGAAAGLGGAALGAAGGVLAIPGIVQMLLDNFAPDWVGPSHYGKTRTKAANQAKGGLAGINDLYGQAVRINDPSITKQVLGMRAGPAGQIGSTFNPSPEVASQLGLAEGASHWGNMTPQQFNATMQWLSQDPSRLSTIGGSGDVPYLPQWEAERYAGEAADHARYLVASQLGLPYFFVEPEHRGPRVAPGYEVPLDPNQIALWAKKEANYKQARDQWAAQHPNVKLDDWKPTYLGNENALTRSWLDANYRDPGFGVG